jgi:acyl carrier protein
VTEDGVEERKVRVREFLGRYVRDREIGDDQDFFALGFVNSLMAMQLIQFLEKEFGISVEDEDLDFDNFRSIDRIDDFLDRKTAASS